MRLGVYNLTRNKWVTEDDFVTHFVTEDSAKANKVLARINDLKKLNPISKDYQYEIRPYDSAN